MTLVNPTTKALTQIHKVVLASGSKYFLEVFRSTKIEDYSAEVKDAKPGDVYFNQIDIPKPVKTF